MLLATGEKVQPAKSSRRQFCFSVVVFVLVLVLDLAELIAHQAS